MILDARKGDKAIVFINGEDVTNRCFFLDTRAGYAEVYTEFPPALDENFEPIWEPMVGEIKVSNVLRGN